MVELEMENRRVEWLGLQHLGENWIQAIQEGAPDWMERLCHPHIHSELLTPYRLVTLENAGDLVAKLHQWFGESANRQLEESRVSRMGERLGIFYRFRLQEKGDWYTIQQHLYCTLKEGQIERLQLLCSGFCPVIEGDPAAIVDVPQARGQETARDGLLEVLVGDSNTGSTCAVLTPAIRSKLREMQTGQVLEVRVDDPSARGDIEAWSRLSGNALLQVIDDGGAELRFFLRKK